MTNKTFQLEAQFHFHSLRKQQDPSFLHCFLRSKNKDKKAFVTNDVFLDVLNLGNKI